MDIKKKNINIFKNFLESLPDAIVIIDQRGEIQSVNKITENMFGYQRDEIVKKSIDILIPPRFKETHDKNQNSFLNTTIAGKMGEGIQLFAHQKNGSEFPVDISLSKIDLDELLICASIRDISQQKKIEDELIKAKEKAEKGIIAKQQFLSNMSHEIRTPMNAIFGFTKVLLKSNLTVKQKEYLSAIKISCDSLIILINDILDLAKVDAGKMVFEHVPFKLSLSTLTMLHLFDAKVKEKNLKLIINYDESIPEVLLGDPTRLHQIILNLMSNAVKFTSKGKIYVKVKKIKENKEKITVKFSISDTGIGIAENELQTIFENFQQANGSTSRLYGGTGLGLAIVKQLVEKQNGSIQVKSKINKGSTFSFTLTFNKTNLNVNTNYDSIELMDDEIKDIKVLVVEDVELNQLLMKTLLDDFGFNFEIVSNGKIALEKLMESSFDIILMDLQMPIMNGFQTAEYIRKTLKLNIPIIALTADTSNEDIEKCKKLGMNDYIAKPVNEKVLYSKILGLIKNNLAMNEDNLSQEIDFQTKKFCNLNYLNKITKSDPALMIEMIEAYLFQTPPLLDVLEDSLKKLDGNSLEVAIHKLIPSFSIMGIHPDIENIAKEIHEKAHIISNTKEIHNKVMHIIEVCKQVCVEASQELKNLKQ